MVLLASVPAGVSARSLYFGISADSRHLGAGAQDLAAETGVSYLREDLEWWRVEPSNGSWNWSETDAMYAAAAEREMRILPIPNSPPCWAVPEKTPPELCADTYPTSNAEYAEFVGEVAKRYGPGGTFWKAHPEFKASLALPQIEIWNEPYLDSSMFVSGQQARYAGLYKAAVIAGRSANVATRYLIESTVDARTGPLPADYVKWAATLLAAEPTLGSYIDGLAVHPYPGSHGIGYVPENGTDEAFVNTLTNYERWKALGVNKPVWVTEVGYSSCTDKEHCVPGATQAEREQAKAELLTPLLAALGTDQYAFVHAVYLYNLEQWTAASEPDANKSNWYGLVYGPTSEHLPAWNSFASAVGAYDGVPEPNTTITGQTGGGQNRTFTFVVNDPTAKTECKKGTGSTTWFSCTSPYKVVGVHNFDVRGVNAEAVESTPAFFHW